MRLIAKRDFRNVGRRIQISNPIHPDHVHKGARFIIGGETPLEKMTPLDKEFVLQLNAACCVSDGGDEKIVALVDAEVAAEKKAAENQAALSVPPGIPLVKK